MIELLDELTGKVAITSWDIEMGTFFAQIERAHFVSMSPFFVLVHSALFSLH